MRRCACLQGQLPRQVGLALAQAADRFRLLLPIAAISKLLQEGPVELAAFIDIAVRGAHGEAVVEQTARSVLLRVEEHEVDGIATVAGDREDVGHHWDLPWMFGGCDGRGIAAMRIVRRARRDTAGSLAVR